MAFSVRIILSLRGQRVMLVRDLAALYGVSTKLARSALRLHRARCLDDSQCAQLRLG
ncbi:MAG: hypothetical protein EA353_08285 [Puniceicoccaceae bacterium]|nr:MAG: hypothetical protein EA353_08285 [Puniceicoccaceae bacterium]